MAPIEKSAITTSEMFESYEEDFLGLQQTLRRELAVAGDESEHAKGRVQATRAAAEAHERAYQALQQMELEAKSMGSLSASLLPKLKEYRSELGARRRELQDAQRSVDDEALGLSRSDRATLADTQDRLRCSSRRLDDTRRSALEAEEIGLSVMGDLRGQRDTIMRTKGHVDDLEEGIATSRKVLQRMGYRIMTNQLIVFLIAVVLTLIDGFVIYLKVKKAWERWMK